MIPTRPLLGLVVHAELKETFVGPIPAVRSVLRQYATFSGRARRSEFWWFTLAVTVVCYLATALDTAVFAAPGTALVRSTPR